MKLRIDYIYKLDRANMYSPYALGQLAKFGYLWQGQYGLAPWKVIFRIGNRVLSYRRK